jgi:hypothetical protein
MIRSAADRRQRSAPVRGGGACTVVDGAARGHSEAMSPAKAAGRLGDGQLREVLPLIGSSDSVELKATVPAAGQRAAVTALGLDPRGGQIRQVFFFDTPELELYRGGLVVRARRTAGKPDDTVVKLRPVVPDEIEPRWRARREFGIEVDAMPGGFVCSASLKGRPPGRDVRTTLGERRPLRKLFTKPQRELFAQYAPADTDLDALTPLGPVFVLKLRDVPAGLRRRLVTELWLYDDGSRLLELSAKCAPGEAFQVAAELRAFLGTHGVDLTGAQQTKTRHALELLAARIGDEAEEEA